MEHAVAAEEARVICRVVSVELLCGPEVRSQYLGGQYK